jgi:hypothetical protein
MKMFCHQCGGLLPPRIFGIVRQPGSILLSFCSLNCKSNYQSGVESVIPDPKKSKLKKPPRTAKEIERARRPSETAIKGMIQKDLTMRRIYHLRLNSGAIRVKGRGDGQRSEYWIQLCPEGTPDNFGLFGGLAVFFEVKKEGEQPSPEQIENHERIRAAGGVVFVVDNFDDYAFIRDKILSEISIGHRIDISRRIESSINSQLEENKK